MVLPASQDILFDWIPACAGMTQLLRNEDMVLTAFASLNYERNKS
jgi:hypothetical protein